MENKAHATSGYAEMLAHSQAKEGLFAELLRYTRKFGKVLEKNKRYELNLGLSQEEQGTLIGKGRTTSALHLTYLVGKILGCSSANTLI